jgi:hypothetical protein
MPLGAVCRSYRRKAVSAAKSVRHLVSMFTPLQSGAMSDVAAQLAATPIHNEEDPNRLISASVDSISWQADTQLTHNIERRLPRWRRPSP